MMQVLIVLTTLISVSVAFKTFSVMPKNKFVSSTKLHDMNTFSTFVQAASEVVSQEDTYQYGSVNAPAWALPLGALLVIATAAIPFLLRPGEAALEQQRIDEETKGAGFNRRKNKDLR
jgi:hypothetical protein